MRNNLPFNFPPAGVLNRCDALQKRAIRLYYDEYGKAPDWFGPFKDAESYIDVGFMEYTDPVSGIGLRGGPDEVSVLPNGTVQVVDYKTAKPKGSDEALFFRYATQVNAYAYLLARQEEEYKVSRVGLLYFLVQTDHSDEELADRFTKEGLDFHFRAHPFEIELDPEGMIPPLLRQVAGLWERKTPPKGKKDCKDCKLLATMAKLAKIGEATDELGYSDDPEKMARLSLFMDFQLRDLPSRPIGLDPDGLLANWDLDGEK
jgi:hypothetical protein